MRIVSWNVRFQDLKSRLAEVLSRIVESDADIVALQEVTIPLVSSVTELLKDYGYVASVDSVTHAPLGPWGRKPFGCMVASKWPVQPAPQDWRIDAPFPESFARCVVTTPRGPVDVMSVHIPNGASNGWKKVGCFRTLAEELLVNPGVPQVVAGDFNEPKEMLPDGSIVTFSDVDQGDNPRGHRLWTDHDGQTGDLGEWEHEVQRILGPKPDHRLRDAHRVVYGGMFAPKTHFVGGSTPRWFDHILVSPELSVGKCGVYSEWRESGVSDHAAVWAELT